MSFKLHWLKEKKNAEKKGEKLIYEEQEKVGQEIVQMFDKRVLVTLCAPPQWGKTGVSLYVSYHMCLKGINSNNVFFITGMSDRSWLDQTRERVLPCWRKNVYHRNTLHKMKEKIENLEKKNDILIIVDECHLANKKQFILGEIFEDLSLNDPIRLKMNNIKILQISATPSNALIDGEEWSSYHEKITPRIKSDYVSFETFVAEDRIIEPKNLEDLQECEDYINEVSGRSSQYHIIRSVNNGPTGSFTYKKISSNFRFVCEDKGFNMIELNMERSYKEVKQFYEDLSKRPNKHTFVLIKNMLGASKTIDDSFIGSVHESTPTMKDYSSEIQGLPGRLCGWTKRKENGPLIYCSFDIVYEYLSLYDSNFDFQCEDLLWKDSRLKVKDGEIKSRDSYLSKIDEETQTSSI